MPHLHVPLPPCYNQKCPLFILEFSCDFYLEAEGLPPANPPSKPTLNCSKQEGGDRCFLTCQSQVHISSGELVEPDLHIAWFTCRDDLVWFECWGFSVCTNCSKHLRLIVKSLHLQIHLLYGCFLLMNQSWPVKLLYIHYLLRNIGVTVSSVTLLHVFLLLVFIKQIKASLFCSHSLHFVRAVMNEVSFTLAMFQTETLRFSKLKVQKNVQI